MNDLFPEFESLAVAVSPISDASAELALAERDVVSNVKKSRLCEYATGRRLARELLRGLGAQHSVVTQSADRSPRWPLGFVGSIAHTDQQCIVVVARARDYRSVGVDLEPLEPIEDELFEVIATHSEWKVISKEPSSRRGLAVRRLFTAKEAVYKCVHPVLGAFLDFDEIEIAFGADGASFTAAVAHPAAADLPLEGRIVERDGCICALAAAAQLDPVTSH